MEANINTQLIPTPVSPGNEHTNKPVSKFKTILRRAGSRKIILILSLIVVGAGIVIFSHAATVDPYTATYIPTVTKQQLIDDISQYHDGGHFPYTPTTWDNIQAQTYTELNTPGYKIPGTLDLSGTNTGIHEWVELSTRENSPTNLNAVVEFKEVGLAAYRQSIGNWETISISKAKELGSTLFGIVNDYAGSYNVPGTDLGYDWSPTTGNRIVGFGLGSVPNHVGDTYPSKIPGFGNERIKAHRTIGNQDWQNGQSYCTRVGCSSNSDIKAIQGWMIARVVTREGKTYQDLINAGNTAGAQQLKDAYYVLMPGWDRARASGGQPGTMGRARRILPEWQTLTTTTMSRAQINGGLPAPPIPGYTTAVNQPPTVTTFTASPASTTTGQSYTLTANASDSDGSVAKIEIFQSGVSKKVCTAVATCAFATSNTATGTYSYTANATDNSGAMVTSVTVNVIVGTATSASLSNGTYNDTDSSIVYSSGWTAATGGTTYLANEHYTNTPGSSATIKFSGEQLTLISHGNTDMGQATITIDGVAQTPVAEWYNSSSIQPKTNWTSAKFPKTTVHTAVITLNSTKNAASAGYYASIDKIVVADAPVVTLVPGLNGQYFNNTTFAGTPTLSRVDPFISNPWVSTGSPASSINADNFSARWTGLVTAPITGSYKFHTWSDDAVQVWINGTLVISDTTWHGATYDTSASTVSLTAGVPVSVKIEYIEGTGASYIEFRWTGPTGSGITDQVVPASALSH